MASVVCQQIYDSDVELWFLHLWGSYYWIHYSKILVLKSLVQCLFLLSSRLETLKIFQIFRMCTSLSCSWICSRRKGWKKIWIGHQLKQWVDLKGQFRKLTLHRMQTTFVFWCFHYSHQTKGSKQMIFQIQDLHRQ